MLPSYPVLQSPVQQVQLQSWGRYQQSWSLPRSSWSPHHICLLKVQIWIKTILNYVYRYCIGKKQGEIPETETYMWKIILNNEIAYKQSLYRSRAERKKRLNPEIGLHHYWGYPSLQGQLSFNWIDSLTTGGFTHNQKQCPAESPFNKGSLVQYMQFNAISCSHLDLLDCRAVQYGCNISCWG